MKLLCVLCVLCGLSVPAGALDREAFTFTKYDLTVRIEPEQQRLAVRGRVTLRNDSTSPQKNLSLQISSSLSWHSITVGRSPVQFVTQLYTSDIDHTGALSEAIVTLPQAVPPKGIAELDIGYEGVIALDTTRLTRIGVPEETAKHTDWDQISETFTAVRGVGYVAWYPVAMEAAGLAGDTVFQAVGRWKARHAETSMDLLFESTRDETVLFVGSPSPALVSGEKDIVKIGAFDVLHLGTDVPTFVASNYQKKAADNDLSTVFYLPGHEEAAKTYADAITELASTIAFVGRSSRAIQVAQLADPEGAPFATERLLLMPLHAAPTLADKLAVVYAMARRSVPCQRAWVKDGLAGYADAAFVAQQQGRQAALDYLNAHRDPLVEAEKGADAATAAVASAHSLINSTDELYLENKAMWVWWMWRDMVGESAAGFAMLGYKQSEDADPAYVQRLIERSVDRDLQWFFDDWVYHDRGLPDLRVASVYPVQTTQGNYLVTVTIENLGGAGAEVPVTVRCADGETTKRLEVRGKSRNSIRLEVPSFPQQVQVNDGSVPESDMSNNIFKVQAAGP